MRAKTILFVIILLTVCRLASAEWKIQFDSEANRVMYLGGDTLRGGWCTRAEAEASWGSLDGFAKNHSKIVGNDCPKQNPTENSSGSSSPTAKPTPAQQDPDVSGGNTASEAERERERERERELERQRREAFARGQKELMMSFKGGASTDLPDLKTGTTALPLKVSDGLKTYDATAKEEIAKTKAELEKMAPDTMFVKQEAPPEPRVNSILRSMKIKAPPLPDMMFSQIQPGDVLLIGPEKALSIGTDTWFYDQLSSWEWGSRACHTVLYLKEVKGVKYFLDSLPGEGPRIKTEDEIIEKYCTRPIDVARPLHKFDSDKLWTAARELGIKQITDDLKKLGDPELVRHIDIGTYYGIYGDDNMVCSEADRWALVQAGLKIANTKSPIKKLLGIYFGPATFYSDNKNFLLSPLEKLSKFDDKR